jgi:2-methylcitrate dehydratase PrpD
MNETRTLVEYCHSIAHKPLPPSVDEYARRLLLDYLGVAAAGAALEESSRIAREVARAMGGAPEATALGLDEKIPAAMAAFANGVTEHSIEMDDTHSNASSHPGVVIWSAALAMAEREGVTGAEVLPAAAAGYEMACRAGYAGAPPSMYKRGFHPTSASGAFGAAVTASALLHLTVAQMLNAVGIVGSFASGNMEYLAQGTLTKRVQPGQAAHAGILSALLAEQGYTGPSTILEGEFGFLHAYSDGGVPARLTANLGESWEIALTGIKAFGCCRYMQSPMEATLRAVRGQKWDPDQVRAIRVGLVSAGWGLVAEPIEDKYAPQTRVDGQFSLPFGVATALVNGRGTVNEFRESQLRNPDILALARQVTIHHDDALDRAYPALWPSWCEIDLQDGRILRGEVNTTKGEPENPMSPPEVREKFDALATTYWSRGQARAVADAVDRVHNLEVQALMNLARLPAEVVESL